MHFLQAINSDVSVLIVCNKTGGTIKGDTKINSHNKISLHSQDTTAIQPHVPFTAHKHLTI